jgi:putative addiction module component (TIGR02574 family)
MTAMTERILDQVLSLPCEDRLIVAEKLLQSLNSPVQTEIDRMWAEEAERRIDEIDSGSVDLIPGEKVFSNIRERLGK